MQWEIISSFSQRVVGRFAACRKDVQPQATLPLVTELIGIKAFHDFPIELKEDSDAIQW